MPNSWNIFKNKLINVTFTSYCYLHSYSLFQSKYGNQKVTSEINGSGCLAITSPHSLTEIRSEIKEQRKKRKRKVYDMTYFQMYQLNSCLFHFGSLCLLLFLPKVKNCLFHYWSLLIITNFSVYDIFFSINFNWIQLFNQIDQLQWNDHVRNYCSNNLNFFKILIIDFPRSSLIIIDSTFQNFQITLMNQFIRFFRFQIQD